MKWCIRMRHSATSNVTLYDSELVSVLKLTHIRCATRLVSAVHWAHGQNECMSHGAEAWCRVHTWCQRKVCECHDLTALCAVLVTRLHRSPKRCSNRAVASDVAHKRCAQGSNPSGGGGGPHDEVKLNLHCHWMHSAPALGVNFEVGCF